MMRHFCSKYFSSITRVLPMVWQTGSRGDFKRALTLKFPSVKAPTQTYRFDFGSLQCGEHCVHTSHVLVFRCAFLTSCLCNICYWFNVITSWFQGQTLESPSVTVQIQAYRLDFEFLWDEGVLKWQRCLVLSNSVTWNMNLWNCDKLTISAFLTSWSFYGVIARSDPSNVSIP